MSAIIRDKMNKLENKKREVIDVYPEIISRILYNRKINNLEDADKFFNPKYEDGLHDPFLMSDMLKASLRVLDAIKKKERITVYGDYDCDGIPASAILHDFFRQIGFKNFEVYIPHRHNEGFGLNIDAVRDIVSRGTDLLITVDNGTTDIESVAEANRLGMEVIITDHHEPKEMLPTAYAILNPKKKGDNYPYKFLSGSGVAFKFVQAISSLGDFGLKGGWEKWLLDLAGIGTIADMVPLTGENRLIASYGLRVLKRTRRPGLINLLRKARVNVAEISEEDVGFSIAPRINAASRLGVPMVAFTCISTDKEEEALCAVNYLESKNNERRRLSEVMSREAIKIAKEKDHLDIVVVGDDEWMPGMVGLIAGKLADLYSKTFFVWGRGGDGTIKGSSRSCGKVNISELLSAVQKDFDFEFGGHNLAGGFSVKDGDVSVFEEKLNKAHKKLIGKYSEIVSKEEKFDAKANLSDINWELFNLIQKMAPFGVENTKPVFLFENLEITSSRKFGKSEQHLEIYLTDGQNNISAYDYYINEDSFPDVKVREGERVNILAHLEKNNYGRAPSLRLRIVNIK